MCGYLAQCVKRQSRDHEVVGSNPSDGDVVIGFELSHERFVRVYSSGHTFPPPRGNWVPSLRRDCICE